MTVVKPEEYRGFVLIDKGHCVTVRQNHAPGAGFTRQEFKRFFAYSLCDTREREHAVALAKAWVDHEISDS